MKKKPLFNDINRYINNTNYDEFYRDKNEQLYTRGDELIDDKGHNYKGLYHIHPEKGPMEGPVHTMNEHKQLFIKNNNGSLEAGIQNLANVKALNRILKILTINNITNTNKSSNIQQDINNYRNQQQLLTPPINIQNQTPASPPVGPGGGSSGGGGGY